MTTRPAAEDDDLLLDALEQEPGHDTLSSSLSPALQAELQGLRAVRRLLDDDTAFGVDSGADLPPAHLFDAILRAEVAARPDVIRQAIVAGHSPGTSPATTAAPTPAWWQRLSSCRRPHPACRPTRSALPSRKRRRRRRRWRRLARWPKAASARPTHALRQRPRAQLQILPKARWPPRRWPTVAPVLAPVVVATAVATSLAQHLTPSARPTTSPKR